MTAFFLNFDGFRWKKEKLISKFITLAFSSSLKKDKMNFKPFTYISFFCFLVAFSTLKSQMDQGNPFLKQFSPLEYGAQSQIWAIVQDQRGVMYFGNGEGVLEYDGKNWRNIKVSNNSTARCISIGNDEVIYVGAAGEFGYLVSDSIGQMKYFSLVQKFRRQIPEFNKILKIHALDNLVYFVATDNIFCYNGDSISVISGKFAQRYGDLVHNKLLIAQEDLGIFALINQKLVYLPHTRRIIEKCGRAVMLPLGNNRMLVSTVENGIFIYDFNLLNSTNWLESPESEKEIAASIATKVKNKACEFFQTQGLYTGISLSDTLFAFGTLTGGILFVDNTGEIKQVFNTNKGLVDNTVLWLFKDRDQNIWAGLNNGIAYLETSSPLRQYNTFNKLESVVFSLAKFNNTIYLGTQQGISYLPAHKTNIENDLYQIENIENISSECWDFMVFKNHLLASGRDGLYEIKNKKGLKIFQSGQIYCFGVSSVLYEVLFLGLTDGFAVCTYKNGKFTYLGRVEGYNFPTRKIVSEPNGDVWLTTEASGLVRFRFTPNALLHPEITVFDTSSGLPTLNYNYANLINDSLYISNQAGIFQKIEQHKEVRFISSEFYNKKVLKTSPSVKKILQDENQNIWIHSEDKGFGMVETGKNGEVIWNSSSFKSLSDDDIYEVFLTDDGNFWISTLENGLCRYNIQIQKQLMPFNALIRKVKVGNDSTIFHGTYYNQELVSDGLFYKTGLSQPENLKLELPFKYNALSFEFSAASFEKSDKLEYRSFLEGNDLDWTAWSAKAEKNYTNLSEGKYLFKVVARNAFGIESEQAQFEFVILPPWYRTWLAYFVYFILGAGFFYLAIWLNSRRLRAANIRLEKIVTERTAEVARQRDEIFLRNEEIMQQKEEIEAQRDELEVQRDKIAFQNKNITDSIHYARRIQTALLPTDEMMKQLLGEHFVLYKPRDIVSGDFYWITQKNNKTILVVADCTGHGVPGAFMSILGVAYLTEIVAGQEWYSASEILENLRKNIIHSFPKSGAREETKDGMDLSLCIIDYSEMKLQYAGANNPLLLVREEELMVLKADKQPIGLHPKMDNFNNQELDLRKGDLIYMFSDGYVDQFGGLENKKFMSKPFKSLLLAISMQDLEKQKQLLEKAHNDWKGFEDQMDDILVIGFKI